VRLLLDSSGAELVCALADAEGLIVERRYPAGPQDGCDIRAAAGIVIGELKATDVTAVVVGLGPGTFIGTRVAISFANGLAATGKVQVYGVNSLAAMAAVYGVGRTVVLRDARRGEAYWYGPGGEPHACRSVAYEAIARELQTLGVGHVVVEMPAHATAPHLNPGQELIAAVLAAGVPYVPCPGVPAEGLRRCQAMAQPATYVEPVYLRGYL